MKNQFVQQVRRVKVTDPIAASRRYDYADAFELRLPGPDQDTPETWVRAGMSSVPRVVNWIVGAMGGGETPVPSDDHVEMFRIVTSTPEVVHLESSDPLMDVVMVGRRVEPTRWMLSTILCYKRPVLARLVWAVVRLAHRWTARYVIAGQGAMAVGSADGHSVRAS